MLRTQIQLTEQQIRLLRELGARRGVSVSELIREAVDALGASAVLPSPEERRRRAIAAAGRFRSGHRHVSRDHDTHLIEAYEGTR